MKVERFEDLICWQKARVLAGIIYELTRLPQFAKDYELVRQIRAAAISAMSNVAEGFERWSRKEFVRFLDIAKGSAGEVRCQLYIALDQHYITIQQYEQAKAAAVETSNTMGGLIGYLERHTQSYVVREAAPAAEVFPDLPPEFVNLFLGT